MPEEFSASAEDQQDIGGSDYKDTNDSTSSPENYIFILKCEEGRFRNFYEVFDGSGKKLIFYSVGQCRLSAPEKVLIQHETIFSNYLEAIQNGLLFYVDKALGVAEMFDLDKAEVNQAAAVGCSVSQARLVEVGKEERNLEIGIQLQRINIIGGEVLIEFIGTPKKPDYVCP